MVSKSLVQNRRVRHDYHIDKTYEAGLVLRGWEVKSLLQGRGQLTDSYVIFKDGEAFLLGSLIQPITTTDMYSIQERDSTRTRKLLLHKREINKLYEGVQRSGFSCVCTKLYWNGNKVKAEIALVKGKTNYDKRHTLKERAIHRESEIRLKGK